MRSFFVVVAAAACVTFGSQFARADTVTTSNQVTSFHRLNATHAAYDQVSARKRVKRTTTGAGSKVGGPNNARPTGTQAPDAQMGGSGKGGAR
jgi:hypothetical protein